jgi:KDO2-lipid IV(A) lauroyltransferase
MELFIFYITYPIIWLVSRLPMWILYLLSDFFSFLLGTVFGYRKEVVIENLQYVFPEKSAKEIQIIVKKFYKHLTDISVESLKSFSISEKEILKRYVYKNPELINKYTEEGRSVALMGAHLANWEWSFSIPLVLNATVFGAYNKLRNETFEKVLRENREKFGAIGMRTSDTVEKIMGNFKKNINGVYILLSDQSPLVEKTFYWSEFFGVKVPIHTGAEMISKKFNLVVINYVTKKIKRGYYETTFELITETPNDYKNYDITEKYIRLTEENIKEQPAYYLWSHKRFKHQHRFEEWLNSQNIKKQTKH